MASLPLILLVICAVLAVAGAKGAKWKLLNVAIIVGFMVLGFGIGWLLGLWGGNMTIGAEAAVPLSLLLGALGGLGCIRRNKWREKKIALASGPEPNMPDGPR